MKKTFPIPVRDEVFVREVPRYCCTYTDIEVDVARHRAAGRHFGVDYELAKNAHPLHAKKKAPMLRHRRTGSSTRRAPSLDQEKRSCTVYDARPGVCRAIRQPALRLLSISWSSSASSRRRFLQRRHLRPSPALPAARRRFPAGEGETLPATISTCGTVTIGVAPPARRT